MFPLKNLPKDSSVKDRTCVTRRNFVTAEREELERNHPQGHQNDDLHGADQGHHQPQYPEYESSSVSSDDSWITVQSGGFLPNWARRRPKPWHVETIQDYKAVVVDEPDHLVCVRFYAPWCRACKAVTARYHQLVRRYPTVKFVEVPLTKSNAYLHTGLGVPSLPFGHIYHPTAGLVEEMKINRKKFDEFVKVLQTYVDGYCIVDDYDGNHGLHDAIKEDDLGGVDDEEEGFSLASLSP